MTSPTNLSHPRLRAAATDGRLENVFKRKDELRKLHVALLAKKDELLDAIVADSSHAKSEGWAQIYLSLSLIKRHHTALAPDEELDKEYRVAHGKDADDRREAVGIVYIEPTTHTFLFSVMSPLVTAIAGGNCVLLLLEQTLHRLPKLVQTILQEALDPNTFDITQTKVEKGSLSESILYVVQEDDASTRSPTSILSPSTKHTVAVVDRTADIDSAAKTLVRSRISFGGSSPYAPDLVLVNEFVKEQLLKSVARHMLELAPGWDNTLAGTGQGHAKSKGRPKQNGFPLKMKEDSYRVTASASDWWIVDVHERKALNSLSKIKCRCLCVHSFSSLDDAIDLANDINQGSLLGNFVFGAPDVCKYLAQFVKSHATFVNHIPIDLLLGPAAPMGFPTNTSERYLLETFTVPGPQFVHESKSSEETEKILNSGNFAQTEANILAQVELEKERPVKHFIGFFEQGILTGLGMTATPLLVGVSALGYYGVNKALARWR